MESPFNVALEDILDLEQNEGYRIVRQYLFEEPFNGFCPQHSSLPPAAQTTFLHHRTIVHSILLPLLQIRQQASHHAQNVLSSTQLPRSRNFTTSAIRKPSVPSTRIKCCDLEHAFRGPARGAFSWLQCFIKEEWEWCITQGCPACIVLKVMHAEPFIRIIIAGCRLSEYLRDLLGLGEREHPLTAMTSEIGLQQQHEKFSQHIDATITDDTRRQPILLPTFSFFLSSLRSAIEEDPFWGMHFYEDIEIRALDLEEGIKDLIWQCCDVCNPRHHNHHQRQPPYHTHQHQHHSNNYNNNPPREIPQSHLTPPQPFSTTRPLPPSHSLTTPPPPRPLPINKITRSSLTNCQLKLQREEQEWMNRIVEACWKTMVRETSAQRNPSFLAATQNATWMRDGQQQQLQQGRAAQKKAAKLGYYRSSAWKEVAEEISMGGTGGWGRGRSLTA